MLQILTKDTFLWKKIEIFLWEVCNEIGYRSIEHKSLINSFRKKF